MERLINMEYYKTLRKHVGHAPLILPGSVVIIGWTSGFSFKTIFPKWLC